MLAGTFFHLLSRGLSLIWGLVTIFLSRSFWAVIPINQEWVKLMLPGVGGATVILSLCSSESWPNGVLFKIFICIDLIQKLQTRGDPKNVTRKFPPLWQRAEVLFLGIALNFLWFASRKIPACIWIQFPHFIDGETEAQRTKWHPWTHVRGWLRRCAFQPQSACPCVPE